MIGFAARVWRSSLFAVILIGVLSVADVYGQRDAKDGVQQFLFRVEIEGVEAGFFRSVSGISSETEVIEYQDGGSTSPRKLPGARKYPNIVLKRGFTGDTTLYDWFKLVTPENPVKKTIRIAMFDAQGVGVAQWTLYEAFPVKWQGPDFDASKNEVAIESLEIAHEGFLMTTPDRP